jgi:hypothetical protein
MLGLPLFSAQASPIRVEFETNINTAFDYVRNEVVSVSPITGKFAIEFDDANAQWGRDEWGPYFQFEQQWINTPVTGSIPFDQFVGGWGQSPVFWFTLGAGSISDAGAAYGYGPGYADQGFSFIQRMSSSGYDGSGLYKRDYTLTIDFYRVSTIATFVPMSTLEFLKSFVGSDFAGGTVSLAEGYRFQRYADSGRMTPYEGLRYMDGSLKVTAVVDRSVDVPEPGTGALTLIGLMAVVSLRYPRARHSA